MMFCIQNRVIVSKFIVIEGIEGSGKSTIASQVVSFLKNHGIKNVILTREPGGTPISELFRSLIKSGKDGDTGLIADYAELLIVYAARVQLLENVIKPALLEGTWVVGDRHDFSSQAYQGGGRGINKYFIKYLSKVVLKDFCPEIIFYLDVPPNIGLSRIRNIRQFDCIESESLDFFDRVRLSYQSLASENSNVVTIDATQDLSKVNDDVCQYLNTWLKI